MAAPSIETQNIETECCIAGGGPAGLLLGYLLARAGIATTVLEKHADFLRDFRGDTLHPSTLEVMHELGLLDRLLQLPHQKVERAGMQFANHTLRLVDFTHLPTTAKFIALMPQWDFLNFIAGEGARFPHFELLMSTEAKDIYFEAGRVAGVKASRNGEHIVIKSRKLTVAADGRTSLLRQKAGLDIEDLGAPIDVLWFRLPRHGTDTDDTLGRLDNGHILILLNRGAYWQCAFVIPKGKRYEFEKAGLQAFRNVIGALVPFDNARTSALSSWDDIKTLTVRVDRLRQWYRDGLLVIGDAAHAMSPVGGVGINLAIQDAVASANLLAPHMGTTSGAVPVSLLAKVHKRRMFPTRLTQSMQLGAHKDLLEPFLRGELEGTPPWPMRLINRFQVLARLPGRIVGLGFRPEHISKELIAAFDAAASPTASAA